MKYFWVLLGLTLLSCITQSAFGDLFSDISQVQEQLNENGSDCGEFCHGHLVKRIKTAIIFSDESVNIKNNHQTFKCPPTSCQPTTADQLLRDGFVKIGNKYYFFSPEGKSWHNALVACQSKGAQLAYPMNSIENDNLKSYLRSHFPKSTWWWLDGNDAAKEGQWVWYHDNSPFSFTDWYKTEPDNNIEASNCLIYWEVDGWRWGDADCPAARRYICQTQPKSCCIVSQ